MATEQEQANLVKTYGDPVRTETVPCVTTQWNFPYDKNRPWVEDDGVCSICGEKVDHVRVGNGPGYSRIATPHTRTLRWFVVDADRLRAFEDYMENY